MPSGVRKAEIDTRNGALIRVLDGLEEVSNAPPPSPTPKVSDPAADDPDWAVEQLPETKEIFNSNVPAEFRRVELFISGTVPNHQLLTESDIAAATSETPREEPTPSPIDEMWQEEVAPNTNQPERPDRRRPSEMITVDVCPITGMRATSNCPYPESKKFKSGNEPQEFCTYHR